MTSACHCVAVRFLADIEVDFLNKTSPSKRSKSGKKAIALSGIRLNPMGLIVMPIVTTVGYQADC
jgi:hypothetical protein